MSTHSTAKGIDQSHREEEIRIGKRKKERKKEKIGIRENERKNRIW